MNNSKSDDQHQSSRKRRKQGSIVRPEIIVKTVLNISTNLTDGSPIISPYPDTSRILLSEPDI